MRGTRRPSPASTSIQRFSRDTRSRSLSTTPRKEASTYSWRATTATAGSSSGSWAARPRVSSASHPARCCSRSRRRLALDRLLGDHLLLAVLPQNLVVAPKHVFALGVEPQPLDEHPREESHCDDG